MLRLSPHLRKNGTKKYIVFTDDFSRVVSVSGRPDPTRLMSREKKQGLSLADDADRAWPGLSENRREPGRARHGLAEMYENVMGRDGSGQEF